jgi:hypothetical protein
MKRLLDVLDFKINRLEIFQYLTVSMIMLAIVIKFDLAGCNHCAKMAEKRLKMTFFFVIDQRNEVNNKEQLCSGLSLSDTTLRQDYWDSNYTLFTKAEIGDTLFKQQGTYLIELHKKTGVYKFFFSCGWSKYKHVSLPDQNTSDSLFIFEPRIFKK